MTTRKAVALVVSVCLVALALGWLSLSFRPDWYSVPSFQVPVDGASGILACDDEGVWLAAYGVRASAGGLSDHGSSKQGERVERVNVSGPKSSVEFGSSTPRSLATATDGTSWLVVQQPTMALDYSGSARLLHRGRRDLGWFDMGAPGPLLGAALESGMDGFAWSQDSVYVTGDGGRTWRDVAVKPWRLSGPNSARLVSQESGGGLLVIVQLSEGGDGASRLLHVRKDLSLQVIWQVDHVSVDEIAMVAGGIIVSARDWIAGRSRVLVSEFGASVHQFREVWSSEHERIHDLQATGEEVYFLAIGQWGMSGFLGATPTALMRAHIGEWRWRSEDVTRRRVVSMCASRDGLWMLGGEEPRITYFKARP